MLVKISVLSMVSLSGHIYQDLCVNLDEQKMNEKVNSIIGMNPNEEIVCFIRDELNNVEILRSKRSINEG